MTNRREFLAAIGGVALGASALAKIRTLHAEEGSRKLAKIGLQLYTVRGLMEKDLEGTLAEVARIGYREVEFAGYFGRTPKQIHDVLKANHLTSPSVHIPWTGSDDDAYKKALDDANAAGHQWAVVPWFDENLRNEWAAKAERFNQMARIAKSRGLRFAYHNHDFEFVKVGDSTALELLLNQTDPKLVDFELDVYWVTKAGGDPLDIIKRHPHRFKLMHAKDATAAPERKMTNVGSGTVDFASIFAHSKQSGMQHVYVERDDAADTGDALASVRASYNYLSKLSFS